MVIDLHFEHLIKEHNQCVEEGKKCIKFEFVNWNVFKFINRFKAEARRYKAIEFYYKALNIRKNVLGENHPDMASS